MTDMATTHRPDLEGGRQTTPVASATSSTETQALITEPQIVRVTVPRWGSKREAEAFAERERAWIEKQQRRAEQKACDAEQRQRGSARHNRFEQRGLRADALPTLQSTTAHRHGPRGCQIPCTI